MTREIRSFPDASDRETSQSLAGADRRRFLKNFGTAALAVPWLGWQTKPVPENDGSLEAQLGCLGVSTTVDSPTGVTATLGTPSITPANFYNTFRGQGIPDDVLTGLAQEFGPYLLDATKGAGQLTLMPADSALSLSISGNRSVEVSPAAVTLIGPQGVEQQRYPLDSDDSIGTAADFLTQLFQNESGLTADFLSFDEGYRRAIASMADLDIEPAAVATMGDVLVNLVSWETRCRILYLLWQWWCRPLPIPLRLAWRLSCYLVIRHWRARCPILMAIADVLRAASN